MKLARYPEFLLRITRSQGIVRRYFVVNGFDGALTMLGLIVGFLVSPQTSFSVIINACLGAAIALFVSGVSSAYVSESAERLRHLKQLEEAMISDLGDSAHGLAVRWVPVLTALVNGTAPLLMSVLILIPLWLSDIGVVLPLSPLIICVVIALAEVFLLGVYLGRVAGVSWISSGIRTLVLALITAGLIYLCASN